MEDISAEQVRRCVIGYGSPGERSSPKSPAEREALRGDHSLDPSLFEADQALRDAAVLVPIVERTSGLALLLTRRTDHLHHHAGQISFPGGRIDPGDATVEDAALRETEEEVGLQRGQVQLLGRLDTYLVRTGFLVYPVVGLVRPPVDVVVDEFEVAEVFEVPLSFFLEPGRKERRSRIFKGKERHFYAYPYGDYFIWGATAGMIANLAEVLRPELAEVST